MALHKRFKIEFLISNMKDSNGRPLSKFAFNWLSDISAKEFIYTYSINSTLFSISQIGCIHANLICAVTNKIVFIGEIKEVRNYLMKNWQYTHWNEYEE